MANIPLIVFIAFSAIFLFNYLIHNWIVSRALNTYIIPDLLDKRINYSRYKWTGFFSKGDFKEKISFGPFIENGNPFINIYLYIYYLENGNEKRFTAKIETAFLSIRKVSYSRDVENASDLRRG